MVKKEWIEKGYVDEPVDETFDFTGRRGHQPLRMHY